MGRKYIWAIFTFTLISWVRPYKKEKSFNQVNACCFLEGGVQLEDNYWLNKEVIVSEKK